MEKIKETFRKAFEWVKKNPVIGIALGGLALFLFYLLGRALFPRREQQEEAPGVIAPAPVPQVFPAFQPGQRDIFPGEAGPDIGPGEAPAWHDLYIAGQTRIITALGDIGDLLRREGRPVAGVAEIAERQVDRAAPIIDEGLAARLRADIARVEGRAADPGFAARMAAQWGSVEQYLAGQQERLQAVVAGRLDPAAAAPAPAGQAAAPAPARPAEAPARPAPVVDMGLVQRLQADIARVQGQAADPGFRDRMAAQWGSVEQYLAGQRARLQTAMRGG